MEIQKANLEDVFELHGFIGKLEGLVQHPVHFYNIMIRNFKDTFFIAKENNKIAGFVWGFISQTNPDILFLWQIGVSTDYRGKNVSKKLINSFKMAAKEKQCRKVQATVEPANIASWKMFEKFGFQTANHGNVTEENGKEAITDYYGSGTNQILYEIEI